MSYRLNLRAQIRMFVCFGMLVMLFQNCTRFESGDVSSASDSAKVGSSIQKRAVERTFYASPQGADSRGYLQNMIQQAIVAGANSQIVLSPGTYRLVCDNRPQTYCLSISGAQGLSIQGEAGKTKILVASPRSGILQVAHSAATIISGVDFDYETPPFTQGTVISVWQEPNGQGAFGVQIDPGYPAPNHPDIADLLTDGSGSGVIFAPGSNVDKWGDAHVYAALNKETPVDRGGGQWQFGAYNSNLTSLLAPGDRIALSGRPTHGIVSEWNQDIQFSQVSIFSAPAMAFVAVHTSGTILLDRLTVAPSPGSNRLLSTNGDAVHVVDSSAPVILQNSYFANMGDDAINIGVQGISVLSAVGNSLVLPKTGTLPFKAGDLLQVTSPIVYGALPQARFTDGEPMVTGVVDQGSTIAVYLSKNVPASARAGDVIFNIHQSSPGSVIQNNTFGSYHGSLRIRSVGAKLINNRFRDARFAKVLVSADAPWNEGPMTNVPEHSGNIVDGGALKFYGLNFSLVQTESSSVAATRTQNPLTPIYRLYSASLEDHNFSISPSEGVGAGYQLEGLVFYLRSQPESGLRPLYRCATVVGGNHFLSLLAQCEGQTTEGILGYISADAQFGGVPLYRAINIYNGHHLQTTQPQELIAPMRSEGILGYVW